MLHNWIKIAFKNFAAHKFNFFINLFGLSIGMVCLIISIVHYTDEQLYEQWHPEKESIYLYEFYSEKQKISIAPPALGLMAKSQIKEIENYTYAESWKFETLIKSSENSSFINNLIAVQENFLDVFPFEFIAGNPKGVLDNNGVALEENSAKKLFGKVDPIGKKIIMHDTEFLVKGVYRLPEKSSFTPNILIRSGIFKEAPDDWFRWNYYLFLKIKSDDNINGIEKKIFAFIDKYSIQKGIDSGWQTKKEAEEMWGHPKVALTPLSKVRLQSKTGKGIYDNGSNYTLLLMMIGLSFVILFSSCINFINTTIANSLKRAKEVSVRKVLGASKKAIIVQFLIETAIICVIAFLLSLVLVEILLPYANDFLGKTMVFNNWRLLLFLIAMLFMLILFSGLIPAIYLSKFNPSEVLKGSFSRSKKGIFIRNAILFLQFVISSFFLIGSLIVYEQVSFMSNKDLGFSGDQVLNINFKHVQGDLKFYKKYLKTKSILETLPEVKEVSASVTNNFGKGDFTTYAQYQDKKLESLLMAVEYNYIDMIGIKLKEGRQFDSKIASDTINNVLVNETFVKEMKWDNALNKRIKFGIDSTASNVIGVVKDFHIKGFQEKIKPTIILHTSPWFKEEISSVQLKIKTDNVPETLSKIENIWTTHIEPGYPCDAEFVNKQFAKSYDSFKKQKNIFLFLSVIVVLIALLGLYAVTSFIIKQRLKEVAIRKVLGAESNQIIYQLSKEFYVIVCLAILCAMPIIYYLTQQWLENFVYRIDMPIMPYVVGFLTLAILTIVVVSLRAYKATQIDMVKYLKYE